jgi:hypothetical protein
MQLGGVSRLGKKIPKKKIPKKKVFQSRMNWKNMNFSFWEKSVWYAGLSWFKQFVVHISTIVI